MIEDEIDLADDFQRLLQTLARAAEQAPHLEQGAGCSTRRESAIDINSAARITPY
jgi:hypothetical protein